MEAFSWMALGLGLLTFLFTWLLPSYALLGGDFGLVVPYCFGSCGRKGLCSVLKHSLEGCNATVGIFLAGLVVTWLFLLRARCPRRARAPSRRHAIPLETSTSFEIETEGPEKLAPPPRGGGSCARRGKLLGVLLVHAAPLLALHRLVQYRDAKLQRRADEPRSYAYYESQKPLVLRSAEGVWLHWYWAQLPRAAVLQVWQDSVLPAKGWAGLLGALQLQAVLHADEFWERMLTLRMKMMRDVYRALRRDDFKVEKDKCTLYEWLKLNELPFAPLVATWSNGTALPPRLHACGNESFPLFVKCCHITQGELHSVERVTSCAQLRSPQVAGWLDTMWHTRAEDTGRPWVDYGNEITDTITRKGFLVQRLAPGVDAANPSRMAEMKVEVLWGRAYLGAAYESPCCVPNCGMLMLLRGETDADAVSTESDKCPWIVQEGHMACVWRLAEKIARIAAVDSIRIDIFAVEGHPNDCMVNEISLSSGMVYGSHSKHMARLWAEVHFLQLYRTFGDEKSKPIYEQTIMDVPAP